MKLQKTRRIAIVWSLLIAATGLNARMTPSAAAAPDPQDVVKRVAAAQAAAGVASADVELRLRVHKAAGEPPDCVFTGTLRIEQGHPALTIQKRSAGSTCAVANRYAGHLFDGQEPLESFLARFEFSLVGQKVVNDDHYYLIQGAARDPKGNPHGLSAWIDDDRGVIPEGTISYSWGDINARQTYTRLNGAWVLTRQFLFARRYDASLEIEYHNFTFKHAQYRNRAPTAESCHSFRHDGA